MFGTGVGESNGPIEERTLWSYVIQIANAMKEVHSKGLAVRNLDVTKVLVVGKNRYVCFLVLHFSLGAPNLWLGRRQTDYF